MISFRRAVFWLPVGSLLLALACSPVRAQDAAQACRFTAPTPRSTAAISRMAGLTLDPNTDSGRGLGGSGYTAEERGIGGSGIVGVVSGFGSICVNGYEVELTDRSVVTVEGQPATAADIRLGHVVVVEALRADDKLVAATVDVRLAAVGPIAAIAVDGATFTILGQTVKIASFGGSAIDSFAVGDWVAVSGLRHADASIEGTSVVRLPAAGSRAMVAGTITADQTGALALGRLAVASAGVAVGDTVVLEGVPQNGVLTAARVVPRAGAGFSPSIRAASVQTFVPGERTMGLSIGAGVQALSPVERPVQIEGRIGQDGNFALGRVEPAPAPLEGLKALRDFQIERGGAVRNPVPGSDGRPMVRPDGPRGERPAEPPFRMPPDRGDKQIERPPPRPEPRPPVPTMQK